MTTGILHAPAQPAAGDPRFFTDEGYTDRQTKALHIAAKYAEILTGSVLDVGCDRAPLRELVQDPSRYVGVDVTDEAADIVVDLDRGALPFADRSFDCVVCTDVLEHLERCHAVFDDLCRVSRQWVVVSLPNNLGVLVQSLAEGLEGRLKQYGLPVDPPADRHRWFFGAEDARQFVRERARRAGFVVEQCDQEPMPVYHWRTGGAGASRDLLDHPNIRGGTLWWALRRRDADGPGA